MQIRTRVKDGDVVVEILDPSDNRVIRYAPVGEGEQVTVTCTTAHSPADLEFFGPEPIPQAESEQPEQVDTGESFEDGGETAEQAAEDLVEDDGEAEQGS